MLIVIHNNKKPTIGNKTPKNGRTVFNTDITLRPKKSENPFTSKKPKYY